MEQPEHTTLASNNTRQKHTAQGVPAAIKPSQARPYPAARNRPPCNTWPFAVQFATYYTTKGALSQRKRTPFTFQLRRFGTITG